MRATLAAHGYRLVEAETGGEGLQAAETRQPDLVILDLGLPDMDGLEIIRRLREWTAVPILVLSARGQEADKVAALDAGADDYVAKPFGVGELLARMRVLLRHADRTVREVEEKAYSAGDLVVDMARRRVSVKGQDVHLTPIEYRLLTTLIKHAGKVLTHRQLLKEVWGRPYTDQPHYLHVYMAQLQAEDRGRSRSAAPPPDRARGGLPPRRGLEPRLGPERLAQLAGQGLHGAAGAARELGLPLALGLEAAVAQAVAPGLDRVADGVEVEGVPA